MHIYYATIIAENLLRELSPYCEIICIAGSVRRKRDEVKDIELVCIPKKISISTKDLFGQETVKQVVVHPEFERIIRTAGKIMMGKFTGRQMKVELKADIEGRQYDINLDLFMPQQHDFWRQFAIRTGSAEYAKRYIAQQWIKKGWCGCDGELRRISECYKDKSDNWHLRPIVSSPTLPPVWKSEEEFFSWLGVQFLPAEQRNL